MLKLIPISIQFLTTLVVPSEIIMVDDGSTVSYHKTVNVTCKEKLLMDTFSGWELDLVKPLDELQVNYLFILYKSQFLYKFYYILD